LRGYNVAVSGTYEDKTTKDEKQSVNIYVWQKNQDIGHTAIKIGNKIYGYYPTDGDDKNEDYDVFFSDGLMHVDDEESFNEKYKGDIISV
jgi:hypothetical protein